MRRNLRDLVVWIAAAVAIPLALVLVYFYASIAIVVLGAAALVYGMARFALWGLSSGYTRYQRRRR